MSRLEEIEAAIDGLPTGEFRLLAEWVRERDQLLWDAQLDDDSANGRLDFLFEEADCEVRQGSVQKWPTK